MKNGKKCAIITGAARGIGRGISLTLAKNNYTVCAVGRRGAEEASVREYLRELTKYSPESFYLSGDISCAADRDRIINAAFDGLSEVDTLINDAGVAPNVRCDILDMTEESFDRVMGVNLRGTFFLTQAVAKRMISPSPMNSFKSVIFITSISAATSSVNRGEYCMSKAGLSMAAKLFADRLAEYGINVYEVRPGIIETDMTAGVMQRYQEKINGGLCPIKRIGQPEDVGKTVFALCEGYLGYSTGEIINVDGGMSIQRL